MRADLVVTEHNSPLAGERLGQCCRHDDVRFTRQARLVDESTSTGTAHTDAMRLVDQQDRPVLAAHLMHLPQWREVSVGTEDRISDDQRSLFHSAAQRVGEKAHVRMRSNGDPST